MKQDLNFYPFVIAQGGSLHGQRWLIKEELIIGREEGCDIVVAERQVSRQHARLRNENGRVSVEDLGSKNGTYFNTQRIDSKVYLQDGDTVEIAMAQEFIYLSADATMPLDDLPVGLVQQRGLVLDESTHRVWVNGVEIEPLLSKLQFDLLHCLYQNAGELVTRNEVIRAVWGDMLEGVTEQALDALVRRLRDRIALIDPQHDYIITMRGHGFRLVNPA